MGNGNAVHRIDYTKLAYEAGRRGHDLSDLTLGPDGVSTETLSRIRQGGLLRLGTVRRIARKLTSWPVEVDLDAVLAAPGQGSGSHRSNVGDHVLDAHRSLEPVPARDSEDDLDEAIRERTRRSPGYPAVLAEAKRTRARLRA